jgi:hypothetical protein
MFLDQDPDVGEGRSLRDVGNDFGRRNGRDHYGAARQRAKSLRALRNHAVQKKARDVRPGLGSPAFKSDQRPNQLKR